MIDERDIFEKSFRRFEPEGGSFERLARRRDRMRRNQRVTAGVVGIAVFVLALWVVTTGAWVDRTQEPAGEGPTRPTETRPTETSPAEIAPPPARAPATPDVVRQDMCSDGAGARLELTDAGDRIKVRFEVHRSPAGHPWRIVLRRQHQGFIAGRVFFEGTRVASENGDLAVQRNARNNGGGGFVAKARDRQTEQFCKVYAYIGY